MVHKICCTTILVLCLLVLLSYQRRQSCSHLYCDLYHEGNPSSAGICNCSRCSLGYYMYMTKERGQIYAQCLPSCPSSMYIFGSACMNSCPDGYTADPTNMLCYFDCPDGQVGYNGKCFSKCPSGTFQFVLGCFLTCPLNTTPRDGQCAQPQRCPQEEYYNSKTQSCEICPIPGCSHCRNEVTCDACIDGELPKSGYFSKNYKFVASLSLTTATGAST